MKCGLLGAKLGHSYSPQIHALLADYEYRLYEKSPQELEAFLRHGDWTGLNVTIPYKKDVLTCCDSCSDVVREIKSANTLVKRPDGTIYADNTDVYGFACLLDQQQMDFAGKKALVLGSGGASVSVIHVLKKRGAEVVTISRSGENHYGNLYLHKDAKLVVNTTPVGMYPKNGQSPLDLREFPQLGCVLDIVYNPARTQLTLQAEALGIPCATGLPMLVAQAAASCALFTGTAVSEEKIRRITGQLSFEMQNIVLIGMPGCGKTSVAKQLGNLTGRQVIDLDEEFQKAAGLSAEQFLLQHSEQEFRDLEARIIADAGRESGRILATGGGCVTREENYFSLHQNGRIVWIQREIRDLSVSGRPLSVRNGTEQLYAQRKPLYERFADVCVRNDRSVAETAKQILKELQA